MDCHTNAVNGALSDANTPLIGLAFLTRHAIAGGLFSAEIDALLQRVGNNTRDASALMDLSTIERLRGNADNGSALQAAALAGQKLYSLGDPSRQNGPALLVFVAPGGFMSNTPIEFLLEHFTTRLQFLFVDQETPIELQLPPHDVAMIGVAESKENYPILQTLCHVAMDRRRVINQPERIARLSRDGAWRLLSGLTGVLYPENRISSRRELKDVLANPTRLGELLNGADFPIIIRPVDSHAGENLYKVNDAKELALKLIEMNNDEFCIAPFVDYSDSDGLFRKYRIALVDGRPYAVHMAISTHWMVHYLNADMIDNAANRCEEAQFFSTFEDTFAVRHAVALRGLATASGLDYMLIDCAEAADGRLLVFEVGTAMIAHSLDCPSLFPYKAQNMKKLFGAFHDMVCRRAGQEPSRMESSANKA